MICSKIIRRWGPCGLPPVGVAVWLLIDPTVRRGCYKLRALEKVSEAFSHVPRKTKLPFQFLDERHHSLQPGNPLASRLASQPVS